LDRYFHSTKWETKKERNLKAKQVNKKSVNNNSTVAEKTKKLNIEGSGVQIITHEEWELQQKLKQTDQDLQNNNNLEDVNKVGKSQNDIGNVDSNNTNNNNIDTDHK